MNEKYTVMVNGRAVSTFAGIALSELIRGHKPCGGHGKCGKCKVIATGNISAPGETERKLLSESELACGIRLACLTYVRGDCEIKDIPYTEKAQIVTDGVLPEFELKPSFSKYGVSIDIGTTTVAARLYDSLGELLSEASCLNPQSKYGADVISRIEAALDGKADLLAIDIRAALNGIISELASNAHIDTMEIDGAVVTGNTVMLSLLTGESAEPFSHAPFESKRLFGETLTADELRLTNLRPDTGVYLPFCISAFVGADITCSVLATGLCGNDTAMLADIGTNGEMAIWHNGRLMVCSTAAGPAFEGVGISMGMTGAVGAIDKVRVYNGEFFAHVIGDIAPSGICGSGIVDAIACMLDERILDESGYLEEQPFMISESVCLTQKDIRMFQLAKSAICAGLLTLIENEKLTPSDITVLHIAGGFGNYLSKENSVKTGLLPKELAEVSVPVGNAALAGASVLLLNSDMRARTKNIAESAVTLDLSANAVFSDNYISGMVFEKNTMDV